MQAVTCRAALGGASCSATRPAPCVSSRRCGGRRASRRVRVAPVRAAGSKQNILVLGGGGREHALAWRLAQGSSCGDLYVGPGNAGTQLERGMTTVPELDPCNHAQVVDFCRARLIDLVLVGPETPLVSGVVDALTSAGVSAFGPNAAGAELEGSKAFMKDLCWRAGIPTAAYGVFEDAARAKAFVREHGAPIVVKTCGLAAGKGVVVAGTVEEACTAVDDMLCRRVYGAAGATIVVEQFLRGEEASFFALVDGERAVPLAGAQDHKAVGDGDTGPNTGGMGSYSPAPVLTPGLVEQTMRTIVYPTARSMAAAGRPYRGVLFAGLMIDGGRVTLLEHNVRFGDPECQSLMLRLRSDLGGALAAMLRGEDLDLDWDPDPSLTVVVAAKGYPGTYARGQPIDGLDNATTAKVFHAGTKMVDGRVVSDGGRVLGISASGPTVEEAQQRAYAAVDAISYPDGFCRRDIGWRAVARERGVPIPTSA